MAAVSARRVTLGATPGAQAGASLSGDGPSAEQGMRTCQLLLGSNDFGGPRFAGIVLRPE